MPFMYPEQLRELRAQYPNTQFDGHGRVVGGTPLNQYNAQPANPAAIPASVRTYSQFDPATGTWVRRTNGDAVPAQSPAPASAPVQGTPINFQQLLGYTPAGFEGATLNIGGRANAQPRQVSRPLARGNSRDISAAITPQPIVVNGETSLGVNGRGITPSGIEFVGGQPVSLDRTQNIPPEYDGDIRSVNNIPASSGVVGQPVVNVDSAEIGQSVPIREATPNLNIRPEDRFTPDKKWESLGRSVGTAIGLPLQIATAATLPGIGVRFVPAAARMATLGRGAAATASRIPIGPAPLAGSGAAANALPNAAQPSRLAGLQRLAIDGAGRLYDATADFARMAYDRAAQLGARVRAGNWFTR